MEKKKKKKDEVSDASTYSFEVSTHSLSTTSGS